MRVRIQVGIMVRAGVWEVRARTRVGLRVKARVRVRVSVELGLGLYVHLQQPGTPAPRMLSTAAASASEPVLASALGQGLGTAGGRTGPRSQPDPVAHGWRLPQGAAVLQLFPFGWMKESGTPHREEIYSSMISAANSSYTRWCNKRWDHAFLRKCARLRHCPSWLKCHSCDFGMELTVCSAILAEPVCCHSHFSQKGCEPTSQGTL